MWNFREIPDLLELSVDAARRIVYTYILNHHALLHVPAEK